MLSSPVTDPVLIFAITMGIILAAPWLMSRLRVPGLVGMILAGTIVGPSVLGLLERDATFLLLGTVGLLYLMFVAGVSIDLAQFAKMRMRSIGFGMASFFIPQLMALGVGVYFLGFGVPAALLLGSIVGSHTLLALPLADRLGITENKSVIVATGATMVTDLLSLIILAIVVASVGGDTSVGFWAQFVGLVGLWVAAVVFLLPRIGRWFLRNVQLGAAVDFSFLMAALFFTAWLAGVVGLAPIIGAFLAGLMMNRLVPSQSPLMTRIKFVGEALFIPFFLVSVGMLIDVRVLFSSLNLWGLALVFTGLVVVGKGGAAKLMQLVFRQSSEEGWTVAGLTIPQAAATLAVTLVGFEVGLFGEMIVNAVVVMILLTSLLGPYLVEQFGRAVALQDRQREYEPGEAPQRILVPLANPETAPALMDVAFAIRELRAEQPIYPMAVAREGPGEEAAVAASEKLLSHAVLHAASADVPVTPVTRVDHNVARAIQRAARERRISTVIIGWAGDPSPRTMIFGSILDQFLEESQATVFVSRLVHPLASVQRVVLLVPPFAERESGFGTALAAVKTMAARAGLTLLVLSPAATELAEMVVRTDPEVPFEAKPIDTWEDLMPALDENLRASDLICFVSVRNGRLAWRPSLLRLPRTLVTRFPEHDFITVYLSEQEIEHALGAVESVESLPKVALPHLSVEHVTLGLGDCPLEEMLGQVVAPGFPEEPARVEELARQLAQQRSDYAPELAPGLALYHLHTPAVTESQLFLGVARVELHDLPTGFPVRAVLVLLVPADMKPGAYLRQLALTAQLVRRDDIVDELARAATPEEARARLLADAGGSRRADATGEVLSGLGWG
jgi:Kef-type K+ transport system membrane component KefB/nucleotide-binding universal stress UspA family protein/mannitol/fructose-specific phosphotransferase system IIA component (Ntr-type)